MRLRAWEDGDVEAFFDIYSRWSVVRWLGPEPRRVVASREEAAVRIARWRGRCAELPEPYGLWAIVPEESAGPVGTALLLPLDGPADEVEVGWHLHPDHEGRGLATTAARQLLDRCDRERVLALTDDDNARSQAVCRRLGMVDEGLTDRWFGLTMRQFATATRSAPAEVMS